MRLTVGQLPPSVYWRRRALVAAGVFVVILLIAYSCSGGDDPEKKPTANATTKSTGEPASSPSSPLPTVITPSASEPSAGVPINGNQGAGAGTGETCIDSELQVTAATEHASVRQGAAVAFYIRIKNIATRLCSRDLGAQEQELYLEQNSAKKWSSDTCGNATGTSDVKRLSPNIVNEYNAVWNGQAAAQKQDCSNRQLLSPGTYQLRARLGNIVSEPVPVTVSA
jgi:hypothetical protein